MSSQISPNNTSTLKTYIAVLSAAVLALAPPIAIWTLAEDDNTFMVLMVAPSSFLVAGALYYRLMKVPGRSGLFAVIVFSALTFWTVIGPLIFIWRMETRVKRYKDYLKVRSQFLASYEERKQRLLAARSKLVSWEEREREFLEKHPDAVLHRAPATAREFELIAQNWMRLWGESDARATQFSNDGGLDVISSNFGAQVKFFANAPVGRPDIQALYGAATGCGLSPVFFAYASGYTTDALEWAAEVGVACFTFIPKDKTTFGFEANTVEAAELALRQEGLSYTDWQELTELESSFKSYQSELPPKYR
jgi:hypothetical protein